MHKFLLALSAALAILPFPSNAADLPVKAPLPPAIAPSSGFYFGANGIGAQLNNKFDDGSELALPGTGNLKPSGGMAGLTVGWFSQGQALIGIEADVDYDFTKHNVTCFAVSDCQVKSGFFLTQRLVLGAPLSSITQTTSTLVRNREGFVVPSTAWAGQLTPYATAGIAERRLKACIDSDCASRWLVGWVVGGGLKFPVSTHVTFDVSYLYVNWNKSFDPSANVQPFTAFKATDEQLLKAGLYLHY